MRPAEGEVASRVSAERTLRVQPAVTGPAPGGIYVVVCSPQDKVFLFTEKLLVLLSFVCSPTAFWETESISRSTLGHSCVCLRRVSPQLINFTEHWAVKHDTLLDGKEHRKYLLKYSPTHLRYLYFTCFFVFFISPHVGSHRCLSEVQWCVDTAPPLRI